MSRIHRKTTFCAFGRAGSNLSLFAVRAAVGIEQEHYLLAHGNAAAGARRMQVLGVPMPRGQTFFLFSQVAHARPGPLSWSFRPSQEWILAKAPRSQRMDENVSGQEVVDAAIAVHRELGQGLLETVYEVVLLDELQKRGFHWEQSWRSWRLCERQFELE